MAAVKVLINMGTLIQRKKKSSKNPYWYYVESARVDGEPRIVRQVYLGTAQRVVETMEQSSRPKPLDATSRSCGLPGALWLAAVDSGLWDCLCNLWPAPSRGPGLAHYILLAAIHRVCEPGPKAQVADWYDKTVLPSLWHFKSSRFTSQAFWDAFSRINQEKDFPHDDLSKAQVALLKLWQEKERTCESLLAYDCTNFYTYIDSRNTRCSLAQRGDNKQKRHDLRQVGLAYVLDAATGIGLFHQVYPGNVNDVRQFADSLPRITEFFCSAGMAPSALTLVFDKGPADLVNICQIDQKELGWVAPVPWSEIPEELSNIQDAELKCCSAELPGVRCCSQIADLWGGPRRCVVQHSSVFAGEQLHSLMNTISKALTKLKRLSQDLSRPTKRPKQKKAIENRINEILAGQWVSSAVSIDTLSYREDGSWSLQFHVEHQQLLQVAAQRIGRTVLATNRLDWSAEEIISAYHRQTGIEREFRAMKDGEGAGWGPMFHWTDSKIRVHAFYTLLGLTMLNLLHRKTLDANLNMSREQLIDALRDMHEIVLVYPKTSTTGPYPTETVLTHQTLDQKQLSALFGLDRLHR